LLSWAGNKGDCLPVMIDEARGDDGVLVHDISLQGDAVHERAQGVASEFRGHGENVVQSLVSPGRDDK
jgi:hypothetical protein